MELPSYEPSVPVFTAWQVIEPKFKYRLAADELTWWAWKDSVENRQDFLVDPIDQENAKKFSSFILQTKCKTGTQYDGCCLISDHSGAMCTFRSRDPYVMDTYRMGYQDFYNIENIYRSGQIDYIGAYSGKIEINGNPPNGKMWMDKMDCVADDANDFTCTGWQPDQTSEFGYDQGYPRFGTLETGIRAGVIDVTKDEPAQFLSIEL